MYRTLLLFGYAMSERVGYCIVCGRFSEELWVKGVSGLCEECRLKALKGILKLIKSFH